MWGIDRLATVIGTLRKEGGVAALTRWRPRSLASFRLISGLKHERVEFKTVVDGGSNVGQFARAVTWAFPQARIYCFEPLPDIAARLRENLADNSRLHVFECALGDDDGEVEFHRNAFSQSSSVLPLKVGHGTHAREMREVNSTKVPLRRLDSVLAEYPLERPLLLKLDLQGFELEALKGATELLRSADYILLEAVFKELYDGEPLFNELVSFLTPRGFDFLRPLSFMQDNDGEIVQIDALFARRATLSIE